jgi:hypothetical protein
MINTGRKVANNTMDKVSKNLLSRKLNVMLMGECLLWESIKKGYHELHSPVQ